MIHQEQNAKKNERAEDDDGPGIEELIADVTQAAAPILLPMIQTLGGLKEDEVVLSGFSGDDEG